MADPRRQPLVTADNTTIRGEVWIAAQPAQVFAALTTPELLAAWWGDGDVYTTHAWEMQPIAGTAWRCDLLTRTGERRRIAGEVLEVAPPALLRLSWRPDWDEQPPTEVCFELVRQDGGTLLRLRHSGFRPDFTGLETHRTGWPWILQWLADFAGKTDARSGQAGR